MIKKIALVGVVASMTVLTGCATYPSSGYGDNSGYYRNNSDYNRVYGTVVRVETVEVGSRDYRGPGLGAVAGVLIGGVLGNQIGSGSGRALATAAGAIGGGFAGDRIEQNTSGSRWAQDVTVELDNGDIVRVLQPSGPQLYRGARVYVSGYGKNARVMLR